MNEDDPPETDRTIIRPAAPPPAPAPEDAAPRTIIAPQGTAAPVTPAPAPRAEAGRIQVGDVLNHIFEVKRFIARGGMGEVFEGINVNSDERVAIKVMLPALAADPNVQAMFRKEARTLTRLSHPALVQYRVLAQEPQLGVFYIVTEYIDGANLSDVLGQLSPSPADLVGLTKRLAEGLRAAHVLGAIHRDISPDNVLLEDGKLALARVIDFGIAKDLDPGSKTIIGDGFAGKLGYVAPEQLGDFDREVGPWTDVYSLALVILAVAQGRNIDIGGSFVEAIDKRRKGIDTSGAPAEVRPVLDRMLVADPKERLRSMDEVIAALTAPAVPAAKSPAKPKTPAMPSAPKPAKPDGDGTGKPLDRRVLIGGGAAAAVLVLGIVGWIAFGGGTPAPAPVPVATGGATPSQEAQARAVIGRTLPGLACTWLDLASVGSSPAGLMLGFTGVAGRPADAEASLSRAVAGKNIRVASSDFSDVAPIDGAECASIDAFRQIRSDGPTHLSVPQHKFEMSPMPPDSAFPGKIGARAVINLDLADPSRDFALYGIEPSGAISAIIPDRKTFSGMEKNGTPIADLGGDRYRLQIDADHSGWSGIILLTGRGGFSDALVTGSHGGDWPARFAAAARANGWRAEMVWFKMVDEVPD
jgi:serine/threonine-protein kinase